MTWSGLQVSSRPPWLRGICDTTCVRVWCRKCNHPTVGYKCDTCAAELTQREKAIVRLMYEKLSIFPQWPADIAEGKK